MDIARAMTNKPTLYKDPLELYVAQTLTKSDDVNMIKQVIRSTGAKAVADLCGGYGRMRLNVFDKRIAWTVIDSSVNMINAGLRLLATHGVQNTTFIHADVELPFNCVPKRTHDLILLAHNSINELRNLEEVFSNIRTLSNRRASLMIKSIVFPNGAPLRNRTVAGNFLSLEDELWQAEYDSRRDTCVPVRQRVLVTFRQLGGRRRQIFSIKRIIWAYRELDAVASRWGFHLVERKKNAGVSLYRALE